MLQFVAIGTIVVGVWLLYYLFYVPFPQQHQYEWQLRKFVGLHNCKEKIGLFLSYFGFSRWMLLKRVPPPVAPPPDIIVDTVVLDGVSSYLVYTKDFKKQKSPGGAMIYFHGGGWTLGSKNVHLPRSFIIARETSTMVVIPDYRLSPEFPFPIPYEDCLKSTQNFIQRCKEFKVNCNKIVLTGESAGGNLAMAVAMEVPVRMTNIMFPAIQFNDLILPSFQQHAYAPLLTKTAMIRFILSYLGLDDHQELIWAFSNNAHSSVDDASVQEVFARVDRSLIPTKFLESPYQTHSTAVTNPPKSLEKLKHKIITLITDPRVAPLVASDAMLANLPRTHVVTSEYDVLRDEGLILVERLKKIGSEVTHQHLDYGIHGQFGLAMTEPRTMRDCRIMFGLIKNELNEQ